MIRRALVAIIALVFSVCAIAAAWSGGGAEQASDHKQANGMALASVFFAVLSFIAALIAGGL